ncbi:putative bifunctional diguanylate cyclase/phosphodiesterase [Roseateles oligotrophus]|uniref:EAL domain-containing protein n=1 Tax=Roseateles oligotrophus TaxID=1769250 RepID=A0ABT2YD07_9BURK|nr:EAL domain-containing protein [Roseateles oligotrophus]MCV2367922.1 EAL domain-containing protein [Roseateles oligotrophus]
MRVAVTLPAYLNLRRLEGRIVALFLALLLVVQFASFAVIRSSIARNADASIAAELKTGDRVFRRLLAQRADKLNDAAELLAKDYGFIKAVGLPLAEQGTVETIKDALANQGERIGASVVAYFDNEQALVTATRDDASRFASLLKQQLARAESEQLAHLSLLGGQVYQVAVVPVKTPAQVGWILMGFVLEKSALQDLQKLSELQAVIVMQDERGQWRSLLSLLEPAEADGVARLIPPGGGLFPVDMGADHMRGLWAPLMAPEQQKQQQQLGVLLLRSFDAAVAPYRELQLTLLALTLIGVAVFALGSVLMARRISGPVKALALSADRLGQGDYETPVLRQSVDEVGDLAAAFELMRRGIRERDENLSQLAYKDQLTNLPNRSGFSEGLALRLSQSSAPFALLQLGLDRFKHVNDVQGHDFGDRLLCAVVLRLQTLLGAQSRSLARLGGDEFVLLLEHADEEAARAAAETIRLDFERALCIAEQTVDLSAGIGIVLSPAHGQDAKLLLSRAALAMVAAKKRQTGSAIYSPQLDAGSQESLSLLSELRRAVEGGQLRLYLQPKVELKTGRVISAEALLRWQHPERGLVPPMQFIPFAEQTGFIRELTRWVLAESAQAWAALNAQNQALRISVNLSTRDLMDQDLPAKISAMLAQYGANTDSLCLEITESAIMDDPQRALETLNQLHEMGFKLSIDDFGTGYSSLAYLKGLPVDELKIDKSFVLAMETDLGDAKIVRSTIELAHNMGLTVVAEGLETGMAWKLLAELGCDEGQGYFIAKPMPQEQFSAWFKAWSAPDLSHESVETMLGSLSA